MKPHQTYGRRRQTTLFRFNMAMLRLKDRYHEGPVGALGPDWLAYVEWLNERKEVLVALRDKELERIATELKRRQLNERKHRYTKSRRGH